MADYAAKPTKAKEDSAIIDLRKRMLGHIRLFQLHIQSNPQATFAVQLYHKTLHSMFRTMERLGRRDFTLSQRVKLGVLAWWAQVDMRYLLNRAARPPKGSWT